MKRLLLIAIALVAAFDTHGVTIVGYDSAVNDRFASGFPGTPVVNSSSSFIGHGYDLSGVGWNLGNPTQGFAMISDRYFIYASHYGPGSSLAFLSPLSGDVVTYNVDPTFTPFRGLSPLTGLATTDFMVGRLATSVVADGIVSYPILDLGSAAAYIGLTALIYGHGGSGTLSPRLGTNVIEGFEYYDIPANGIYDNLGVVYENQAVPGEASFQGGDSGSPSFVAWNGQLALLGNHSAVATDTGTGISYSLDNFAAQYLSQMAAANISFTSVPEPSRMIMLCGSFLAVMLRRRR